MILEGAYAPEPGTLTRARIEGLVATIAQAEALGSELAERLKPSNATPAGAES